MTFYYCQIIKIFTSLCNNYCISEKKENYIRLDQQRERDFQMNELNKLKHKIKTFRNKKHDQSTWAFEENFAQPLNLPEKFWSLW